MSPQSWAILMGLEDLYAQLRGSTLLHPSVCSNDCRDAFSSR